MTVAPQCSADTWFDLWEHLEALAEEIVRLPYADTERIYLMGSSMGGYGTWQLAMSMPTLFAAIVPICGGGMYWNAGRLVNVPVWAFHGGKDPTVYVEESKKMVDAVNRAGGNAKLTVYPENGHDAWSDTYSNEEVFRWLLQQKKAGVAELSNKYDNAKKFG
ncbi:MAG: prolyl oligopeptidase family serine peptidase [Oscillospiraceae bacterium]|nr:prolyl oligopeptidase family serine peptidase [Oscillospiraceae bacterium]